MTSSKPIILIGLHSAPERRLDFAVKLLELGWEELAYRVAREENVLHFDMATLPERGDALDRLDEGSLVIAHHLFYDDLLPSGFFYNQKNERIVELADRAGVPLLIYGDYPLRARAPDRKLGAGLRLYLPPGRSAFPNPAGGKTTTDLRGRVIPEKYLAGLPPALRAARIRELTESRDAYGTGDFSELPTDVKAREMGLVKLSAYRKVAQDRGFDISQVNSLTEMAEKALSFYTGKAAPADVRKLADGLQLVYNKGLAAWKSGGHRPGATGRNWADARLASLLVGGKAAWTADRKQFDLLPRVAQQEVVARLPEVYAALKSQGRKADIEFIAGASRMRRNPHSIFNPHHHKPGIHEGRACIIIYDEHGNPTGKYCFSEEKAREIVGRLDAREEREMRAATGKKQKAKEPRAESPRSAPPPRAKTQGPKLNGLQLFEEMWPRLQPILNKHMEYSHGSNEGMGYKAVRGKTAPTVAGYDVKRDNIVIYSIVDRRKYPEFVYDMRDTSLHRSDNNGVKRSGWNVGNLLDVIERERFYDFSVGRYNPAEFLD